MSIKIEFSFIFKQGDDTYLARQNSGSEANGVSLHVLECFKRNITGKGIRITVLDDGLEHSHQDIKDSYVSLFSKIYAAHLKACKLNWIYVLAISL